MMKRLKHVIIFLMMAMLIFALPITSAYADTPEYVTRQQAVDRLDQLYEDLGGKYFTTTQKAAAGHATSDCNVGNVVKKDWLKKATDGMVPKTIETSGTFRHFYNGSTLVRGYSCCGFANYAQWYVFAQDSADIVKTKEVAFVKYNKTNMMRYAQPGDVIRVGSGTSKGSSTHSAIVYSVGDDGVTVIDSNWTEDKNNLCKVTKHKIKYSSYAYVGITRATNYHYATPGYYVIVGTSNEVLNMREEPSAEASILAKVPKGTKVKVVDTVGNWGKFEYNGMTGWSNMDYMYFSGTYINTLTFDANGGSGTMNPMQFEVGVGFTVPECGFTKEGYHCTGWYMELEGTALWRCKDPVANKLGWFTEEEITGNFRKHLYPINTSSNMTQELIKGGTYIMHAQWEPCTYEEPVLTPATYGTDGAYTYTCTVCQGEYVETIPGVKSVTLSQTKYTYNGTAKKPTVTIKDAVGNKLVKDTDYTVSYSNNLNPGQGKVTIKFKGEYTGTVTKTFDIKLPAPTIEVSNVASSGKLKVTWETVDGADKYEVYRKIGSNGTYEKITTTTSTSYTHSGAKAGKTYYYKVKAINEDSTNATSEYSNAVSRACDLAKPTNIKVVNVASSGKPNVTWDAVSGADKYYVYRKIGSSGTFEKITTTTSTSYTHSGAKAGKTYYYKVMAVDADNSNANSTYSSTVSKVCDLAKPTNVKVTLTSSGKPKVTWDTVKGADKYYVYRKIGSDGTYEKITTTTSTSFTHSGAKAGKTYYYKIKAVYEANSNGNSAYSSVVSATTK